MASVVKNLAESGGIYIDRWINGLITQRHPLAVTLSSMGLQVLTRYDALLDGHNMEISSVMTPVRSYGYSRFCSAQFGSSDFPQAFWSFTNLSGTTKLLVDTPTKVVNFTTSAQTTVFTKNTTNQTSFETVANMTYMCDGNDSDTKKWDGTTATKWGIVAPVAAPSITFPAGSLSPTRGYHYVSVYKNSSTGHPSNASPVSASTGPQTSKNFTVSGTGSTDGQVDKIDIYRTEDGGSTFNFLATINNPGGTSWSYTDSTADSGLNTFILAPLSGNEPPPLGITLTVFHQQRMWGASGRDLYFASGPDCTNGVPEEAWNSGNVFHFPKKIRALASTSAGLLVFTRDNAYIVLGSDKATFYPRLFQKNFGVMSQNAIAQDGDVIFVFTSRSQLFEISDELSEVGQPIRNKLKSFNSSNVYLSLHRSGDDEGLFVCDGSTNIYRYSIALGCWSPVRQPVGGVKAIGSIETSTGVWTLLAGRTAGSGYILQRDTTTYLDDSVAFTCDISIGQLILAPPRQTVLVTSILIEAVPVGTYPTVGVLLNEVSGTFTSLPDPVPDPPLLLPSTTVWMKRHDFKKAKHPLPEHVRHMQVNVSFPAENQRAEILGLALA
jgi:hypothetical protein